ncbi:MAG: hypothetical protein NW214_16555 [Pseudanabaenaceae cyanobacterium bins.39]|nr:hypothetical protein [Pseudanabaenaceae cyanobacterium bins.39]
MSYQENNKLEQENQSIPCELLIKFKDCFVKDIDIDEVINTGDNSIKVYEIIQGENLSLLMISKIK